MVCIAFTGHCFVSARQRQTHWADQRIELSLIGFRYGDRMTRVRWTKMKADPEARANMSAAPKSKGEVQCD
jgi:hypothetical protein